jgi:hypothetical protein
MLKSGALFSDVVDTVIKNNKTESVSQPVGFPVFKSQQNSISAFIT